MIKIRQNVFETNSSSTHTITMCSEDTYNKWMTNMMYFDLDNEVLVDEETMFKEISDVYGQDAVDELKAFRQEAEEDFLRGIAEYSYYTRCSLKDSHTYEHFHDKFVTPNGETVHAFGWYGSDY